MPESPADKSALEQAQTRLPLNGLKVLDLTHARAGPTAVRHLADWGADVIKIEPPATDGEEITGNRHGFDFQNLHRNKRPSLNLKTPRAYRVHAVGGSGHRPREHARAG
jgi:formyl-CoA transferase